MVLTVLLTLLIDSKARDTSSKSVDFSTTLIVSKNCFSISCMLGLTYGYSLNFILTFLSYSYIISYFQMILLFNTHLMKSGIPMEYLPSIFYLVHGQDFDKIHHQSAYTLPYLDVLHWFQSFLLYLIGH